MWQPSPKQWAIIWFVAFVVLLGWPPERGQSLGTTLMHWAVDPNDALPPLPASLPMGLDDDGDAVTAHDMQEAAWHDARERSALNRWRMDLKVAGDPLPPSTARQLLVGLAVVAALTVWRMDATRAHHTS
ncbi:MAG: hypothetical protein QM736_09815 [Vicinamibacterales bacterium]